jgi:hypothetical protein
VELNVGLFDVGGRDVTPSVCVVGSTLTLPSADAGDGIITVVVDDVGAKVASSEMFVAVVGETVGISVAAVEPSVSAANPETRIVTYSPFSSSTAMDMPVGTMLPLW